MLIKNFEIAPSLGAPKLTPRQEMAIDAYRCAYDAMKAAGMEAGTVWMSNYGGTLLEGFDEIFDENVTQDERGDVLKAAEVAAISSGAEDFLNKCILWISAAPDKVTSHLSVPEESSDSVWPMDRPVLFSAAKIFAEVS